MYYITFGPVFLLMLLQFIPSVGQNRAYDTLLNLVNFEHLPLHNGIFNKYAQLLASYIFTYFS